MFAALAAITLGGIWFWGLAVALFLIAVVSVENEKFSITTPVVIGGIALLMWLSHFPVVTFVKTNWLEVLEATITYLVIGVLYGGVRYWFYVHRVSDRLTDYCNKFGFNRLALTTSQAKNFASSEGLDHFPLRVSDSKQHIIFWNIYWPFSAPWTLINEPVKRFFNFAYGRIAGLLQGISDRVFKDVKIVEDEVKPEKQKLFG